MAETQHLDNDGRLITDYGPWRSHMSASLHENVETKSSHGFVESVHGVVAVDFYSTGGQWLLLTFIHDGAKYVRKIGYASDKPRWIITAARRFAKEIAEK